MDTKLFYTPREFRKILGCSRHLCYKGLRQKTIRSFRLGRRFFIPAAELARLSQIEEQKSHGDDATTK